MIATDAEPAERGDAGVVELREVARAEQHAGTRARRARREPADVAEVDRARDDRVCGALTMPRRSGVAILPDQVVAGGTG